jgi:ParB family chromosome partitioning protein
MPKMDMAILNSVKTASAGSFADKIKSIDIDKLVPHCSNFYPVSDIELLAEDIERQGLKSNLVVRDNGDGTYTIISGHRRFGAIKLLIKEKRLSTKFVPCYVNPPKNADDEMLDLIMLNATTRVIDDAEMLMQYERLRDIFAAKKANGEKFGRVREKIAEVMGVSAAQVGKIEKIVKNEDVKKSVIDGSASIYSANIAVNEAKNPDHENCATNSTNAEVRGGNQKRATNSTNAEVRDGNQKRATNSTNCPHCGGELKGLLS